MSEHVHVDDLDSAIDEYQQRGYGLDMIFPADDPREARMSRDGDMIWLQRENHPVGETLPPLLRKEGSPEWIRGRAGMEYRDLIPDRLGGKVIASHIRLIEGGPVPDYIHYHKIDLQVIYCNAGRIKVVYEDQGEPIWLEAGDLVLQPPEIRHRVLECTAGSEVIEITSPAEHETWVDHEMKLPTSQVDPERLFGERRFFRHICRGDDARDPFEEGLAIFSESLLAAKTREDMLAVVTTFSQSLCQM